MKEPAFFTQINNIYEEKYHQLQQQNNLNDKQQEQCIIEQVFDMMYQQNSDKFISIDAKKFHESFQQYDSYNDQLVTFKGTIVDIFQQQITTKRLLMKDQSYKYILMSNIMEQNQIDIKEEDIVDAEYLDIQPFLVFLEYSSESSFTKEVWQTLNDKVNTDVMIQKTIPIVVFSYIQNQNLRVGQKMKFYGYLKKQKDETDSQPQSFNNCFQDYYNGNIIYTLHLVQNKLLQLDDNSLSDNDIKIVQMFKQQLQTIFNDPLAALIIIFGLISDASKKVSGLSLNFLNVNVYNCQDSQIEQFQSLMNELKFDVNWINVNKQNLERKLFAIKNYEYDIMELHDIFVGSNTTMIIDERNLEVTKFTPAATQNIMRLQEIVQFQKLSIFFSQNQIFKYDFNNQVISFSEGRSIFPFQCKVCVVQNESQFEEEFDTNIYKNLKNILSRMNNKLKIIDFKEEDLEDIQKSFVELRQTDKEFSQDNFAQIIKLAKHLAALQNISKIDKNLFYECIFMFKELQKREENYLKQIKEKNGNQNQIIIIKITKNLFCFF